MTGADRRRRRWENAAAVLVVATLAAALLLPVPYVTLSPGPVFDVLGEIDGEPVVQIEGTQTYPTTGRLDMTTASTSGASSDLSMGRAVVGWLSPNQSVEPRDVRFPEGSELETERQIDAAVFEASASSALAAAANHLGRPVDSIVLVSSVTPDSPADGVLLPGDQIAAVAGTPTSTAAEVSAAAAAEEPGATIAIDIIRDGAPRTVEVIGGERPDGTPGAFLGVLLVNNYTSDFTAEVTLEGIGGPSAGMVFAIAMVDQLTPQDLLEGGHVAGTGTIDALGRVGAVGSVDKKMVTVGRSGAALFLIPPANCADVVGDIPEGLQVVPVASLQAAVDSVNAWRAGDGELPGCS